MPFSASISSTAKIRRCTPGAEPVRGVWPRQPGANGQHRAGWRSGDRRARSARPRHELRGGRSAVSGDFTPIRKVFAMSNPTVVGFSGNITRPSKTRAFVDLVVRDIAARHGLSATHSTSRMSDRLLGTARSSRDLDRRAEAILAQIVAADVLVVGSPTYKGSYTGLFKHFFDLVDPSALRGKPILLTATGGGERHALIVEHQLRPLFGFFEAFALPTAIYATDRGLPGWSAAHRGHSQARVAGGGRSRIRADQSPGRQGRRRMKKRAGRTR